MNLRLLESINSPADLKKLSLSELETLAQEIRQEIISTVERNGGHLGANLGVVELTLATDTFLTAVDRRNLHAAHPGIVAIIPEVANAENLFTTHHKQIDLSRSVEALFRDYFFHEKGQEPNEEIMQLFTEIMAEEKQ